MLTVLFPMSGANKFKDDLYQFPKPLIEINGLTMIERVINMFKNMEVDKYIFIINENDCKQYHLDNTLRLLLGNEIVIIKVDKPTQGAACSALLAIEHIEPNDELIISNSDHVIEGDLYEIIKPLRSGISDAGVISFESVHPKWSYVRVEENTIVESAEKRPISHHAIAGIYYYNKASFFMNSAMNMIVKQSHVDNIYYISPTLNELILEQKNLQLVKILSHLYFHFYDPEKIREYELFLNNKEECKNSVYDIEGLTYNYISAFNSKDINLIGEMLLDDFCLEDPVVKRIEGKIDSLKAIKNIFKNGSSLNFSAKNIFVSGNTSIIEFNLLIDNVSLFGTDIIEWKNGKLLKLRAYFNIPKE